MSFETTYYTTHTNTSLIVGAHGYYGNVNPHPESQVIDYRCH